MIVYNEKIIFSLYVHIQDIEDRANLVSTALIYMNINPILWVA